MTSPDIKFGGVTLVVHKRGNLYRTKWKENGKSTKKNWDMRHVVLTEKFLMFFKSNRYCYYCIFSVSGWRKIITPYLEAL